MLKKKTKIIPQLNKCVCALEMCMRNTHEENTLKFVKHVVKTKIRFKPY